MSYHHKSGAQKKRKKAMRAEGSKGRIRYQKRGEGGGGAV